MAPAAISMICGSSTCVRSVDTSASMPPATAALTWLSLL